MIQLDEAKKQLPKSIFNGLLSILDTRDPIFRDVSHKVTSFSPKKISNSSVEKHIDPEVSKFEVFHRLKPIDFDAWFEKISHERNADLEIYLEELKMAANYIKELSKLNDLLKKSIQQTVASTSAPSASTTFLDPADLNNLLTILQDNQQELLDSYRKIDTNITSILNLYKK